MNRLYKPAFLFLCVISTGAYGQTQTKTYAEQYNVKEDAVLKLNTAYADIEFETWDKNEIAIDAKISIEDASEEDALAYFEKNPIKITGNSTLVEINTTKDNNGWNIQSLSGNQVFVMPDVDISDLNIELSEFPALPEMPKMPPLPITSASSFNYSAYKKDGEEYMKKWQKEFEKSFDEEHKKKMEEWAKRVEERGKALEERMKAKQEERSELQQERIKIRASERAGKRLEAMMRRKNTKEEDDSTVIIINGDSVISSNSNIFYFNSGKENKLKVKKTIHIKVPKSVKLKMDVRHGEVILAANATNINANLSHASLSGNTIDGDETLIMASYSPISISQWNIGYLQSNYSDEILLENVKQLDLKTKFSDVKISKLFNSLKASNSFGVLEIGEIAPNYSTIVIDLKNAELDMDVSGIQAKLDINDRAADISAPTSLQFTKSTVGEITLHHAILGNANASKSIKVDADYSEVRLKQ